MLVAWLALLACTAPEVPPAPPPIAWADVGGAPAPEGAIRRFGAPGWGEPVVLRDAPQGGQAMGRGTVRLPVEQDPPRGMPAPPRLVPLERGRWALARRAASSRGGQRWEVWDAAIGFVSSAAVDGGRNWWPTPDGAWLVTEDRAPVPLARDTFGPGAPAARRARLAPGYEVVWSRSAARILKVPSEVAEPAATCIDAATSPDGAWTACRVGAAIELVGGDGVAARWADAPEGDVIVAPGGGRLAVSGEGDVISAWTPATNETWTREAVVENVSGWQLAFAADGALLLGARPSSGTLVLDAATGARLDAPGAHADSVRMIAVHPDGRVATRDGHEVTHVWAADGAHLAVLTGERHADLRWEGSRLLQASSHGAIGWELPEGADVAVTSQTPGDADLRRGWWRGRAPDVGDALWRDDAPWITWPTARGSATPSKQHLAISPSERWAVTDRSGELLDLVERAVITVPGVRWPAAPDDDGRVWVADGERLVAWRAGRGAPVHTWDTGLPVTAVTVGADAVYAGHSDGTVTAWPLPAEVPAAPLVPRPRAPLPTEDLVLQARGRRFAVSDDGQRVALGRDGGGIALWDVATGRELAHVVEEREGLAFEPDGTLAYGEPHLAVRVSPEGVVTPSPLPRWPDVDGWRWGAEGLAILSDGGWIEADASGSRGRDLGWADRVPSAQGVRLDWSYAGGASPRRPPGLPFAWWPVPRETKRVIAGERGQLVAVGPDTARWVRPDGEKGPVKLPRPAWLPASAEGFAWGPDFDDALWVWLDDDTLLGAGDGWLAAWEAPGGPPAWVRPSFVGAASLAVAADGRTLAWWFDTPAGEGPDTLVVTDLEDGAARCVLSTYGQAIALAPDGARAVLLARDETRPVDLATCELGGPVAPPPERRAPPPPAPSGASAHDWRPQVTEHGVLGRTDRGDVGLWHPVTGELLAWVPSGDPARTLARVTLAPGAGDRFLVDRRDDLPDAIWTTVPLAEEEVLPAGTLPERSDAVAIAADGTLATILHPNLLWLRPPGGPARVVDPGVAGAWSASFSPEGGHLIVRGSEAVRLVRVAAALARPPVDPAAPAPRPSARGPVRVRPR